MNKQNLKIAIILLFLFIADRFVKIVILNKVETGFKPVSTLFSSFINKPEINSGIALSLPLNNTLAIVISVIAIVIITWHLSSLLKYKTWPASLSRKPALGLGRRGELVFYWGLIIIGAFGNLLDRIAYQGVVDYLSLPLIPSLFNPSDAFIFIGAILLALNTRLYSTLSIGQSLAGLKDKQDSSK